MFRGWSVNVRLLNEFQGIARGAEISAPSRSILSVFTAHVCNFAWEF